MSRASIWDRLSVVILLAAFLGTLALYGRLPERIPSHFDIHGEVDATLPRAIGAFIMPVFGLGIWALLRFGASLLPGARRDRLRASPVKPAAALVLALLFALHVIMIHAALAGRTEAAALLGLALSGFWLVMGLVLPRIRRNPFIGIRTTWTLTSGTGRARTASGPSLSSSRVRSDSSPPRSAPSGSSSRSSSRARSSRSSTRTSSPVASAPRANDGRAPSGCG